MKAVRQGHLKRTRWESRTACHLHRGLRTDQRWCRSRNRACTPTTGRQTLTTALEIDALVATSLSADGVRWCAQPCRCGVIACAGPGGQPELVSSGDISHADGERQLPGSRAVNLVDDDHNSLVQLKCLAQHEPCLWHGSLHRIHQQ